MTLKHGESTIILKGNIIHITLEGAFNEYGAKEVSATTREIINTLNQKEFLILANLLNLNGATPEAFSISNEFNAWLNNQNMVAKAIVIQSDTVKEIDKHWVPSKAIQNIEYFDNEDDALIWLKKQLQL